MVQVDLPNYQVRNRLRRGSLAMKTLLILAKSSGFEPPFALSWMLRIIV